MIQSISWFRGRVFVAASAAMIALVAPGGAPLHAQEIIEFDIARADLATVVTAIARQSGTAVSFPAELARGRMAGPIQTRGSMRSALDRALAGTGLEAVSMAGGGVAIRQAGSGTAGAALAGDVEAIDVTDLSGDQANSNGSSDPQATEGSKSYVAKLSNAASKTPLSIKETPQSVSVLTDQQIKDRNTSTLDQAVAALPGLNVQTSGTGTPVSSSSLNTTYSSRGFTVDNISVDGGTPMQVGQTNTSFNSNYRPIFDLSQYDSVAVVRGSGGTYAGVGDPGGVLALQRKRPQGQFTGSIEQNIGTYGNLRTVGDITTGPILSDLLNLRTTFVHDDTNYMYDPSFKKVDQFYINAEITPSDWTKINLGATVNKTKANPWYGGLPTLADGTFAPYSRSTALTAPWTRTTIDGQEYFLQLDQKLFEDWKFKFNGTINKQEGVADFVYYNLINNRWINPDGTGAIVNAFHNEYGVEAYATDAFVNGREEIFGMPVELTFGHSYKHFEQAGKAPARGYYYSGSMGFNTFDPPDLPQMPLSDYSPGSIPYPTNNMTQMGGYASVRISPLSWAHLQVSERISTYKQNIVANSGTTANVSTRNTPIPDVGLTLDLNENMSIYGSYATIFQPQALMLSPTTWAPPVTGSTWEAGIKRTDFDGRLQSSIAFYTTEQFDMAVADPNNPPDPNGLGLPCCYVIDDSKSRSKGIDIEVMGEIMPNWDLSFSYNYNKNEYTPGAVALEQGYEGATLMYSFPRHSAKLFTTFRPYTGLASLDQYLEKARLGFGAEYRSSAENTGVTYKTQFVPGVGFEFLEIPYTIRQDDYVIFNAMAKYDFNEKTTAQINVTNLFDKKYYQSIGTPTGGNWYGPGFSAVGSLRFAF